MTFKFESPEFKRIFEKIIEISKLRNSFNPQLPENIIRIAIALEGIKRVFPVENDLSIFDEKINYSIRQEGFDFIARTKEVLTKFNTSQSTEDFIAVISQSAALIYIYLREYEFQIGGFHPTIGIEIGNFLVTVGSELKAGTEYSRFIDFGDRDIPFNILKEIFLSEDIRNLNDLLNSKEEILNNFKKVNKRIAEYESSFVQKQNIVEDLEKRLEQSKLTYDFVLLNKGFKQLHDEKKIELKERRNSFSGFGATLAITPLIVIVFSLLMFIWKDEAAFKYLLYLTFPVSTFMLIILYFVRVSLQHVRSVQSQMMQLELRMALCQFIHNYAEDSEILHKKNSAGFEKFENIIFSPLVSSDDKIPTTFDGMEQLAKMVDIFRKN